MENPFEVIETRLDKIEQLIEKVLLRLDQEQPQQEAEQTFNVTELAEYLKCSRITVYKHKKSGAFPFYQIGRTILFKKTEIDRVMHSLTPIRKGRFKNL